MFTKLLSQSVTLHISEPEARDSFGDETMTETAVIVAGLLQVRGASEDPLDNTRKRLDGILYVDAHDDLDHADACTVDGERWEFDGDPQRKWNPRLGRYNHTEVSVTRRYG